MNTIKSPLFRKYLFFGLVMVFSLLLAGCNGLLPQFTYQGVLTNASGSPISGQVDITYRVFNVETGGTSLYDQTETVTVDSGRFDSIVGPTSVAAGLTPEDLAQPLWIEIEIDNGTYTEILTPRQKLYGAPYAFTLMPGSVIASTMNETIVGAAGVDAIVTVSNLEASTDSIPALRVYGDHGIELVDADGSHGSIYSDMDNNTSDLYFHANDDVAFFLDDDGAGDADSRFWVYGDGASEYCWIDAGGNLLCTGTITQNGLVNGEIRSTYALGSSDVRIEDFGSAQLVNGQATIEVEPLFAETVNLNEEYHVFLTPLGECNGLYVTHKTATGFEVRELGGGTSDVSFDYRIVAKRAGYEDIRLEVVPTDPEVEGR